MPPTHTPRVSRRALITGSLSVAAVAGFTNLTSHGGLIPSAVASTVPAGTARWDDPSAWPDGRIPTAGDVAVVDRPLRVSGTHQVAGIRVLPGGSLEFDPQTTTRLRTRGNVVVHGTLRMRPASDAVLHQLTFIDVDESKYVGGGMMVLESDVGLWVEGSGVLDAQGTERQGWNRTGAHPTWRRSDEVYQAPYRIGDFKGFERHSFAKSAPVVGGALSDVRTEVFNVTRNVVIGGRPEGRAHVMFLHAGKQQVRHVRFEHLGPRKVASDGVTELVPGRYGFHFHHCKDATRGSLVEGVVVAHCGTRAFVPHASHGITMRDCIAFDTANEAYWWDPDTTESYPGNATNDLTYDRCAAFGVGNQPNTRNDITLSAFHLGQGQSNSCVDSVAAALGSRAVESSGFEWPENNGRYSDEWVFKGCVAHNNNLMGIFFWQNDPWYRKNHVIEDFLCYRNGGAGVEAGAYVASTTYRRGRLVENCTSKPHMAQFVAHVGWGYRIEDVSIDPGGRSAYALSLPPHRTSKDDPTVVARCDLHRGTKGAVGVVQGTKAGYFDFVDVTVNGRRNLRPRDFDLVRVAPGTRFRIQKRNGRAFKITRGGHSRIQRFA